MTVFEDDKFEKAVTKRIDNMHSEFSYYNNAYNDWKWVVVNPLSVIWDLRIEARHKYVEKKIDERYGKEANVMARTIFVYRGTQHEKLRVDSLRQGDTIRIYNSNSHDYREYYVACDSWMDKYIVSDKFDIYNFDIFIETLSVFNNRMIEII